MELVHGSTPALDHASIASNYARIIARELGLNLKDLPKLLRFTTLTVQQFMQEDTLLSIRQFIQILHNSLSMTTHADLGLRLGKRLIPTTHGPMGFLLHSSPNLLVSLQAIQAFLPTRMSFATLEIAQRQAHLHCRFCFNIPLPSAVLRIISEMCAVILYECAEFIIGRPLTEAKLSFIHPSPDYHAQYAAYLGGELLFSRDNLEVEIPLEVCEIPNASANHEMFSLAMQQCEDILKQLQPETHDVLYQIQKMMLSNPIANLNEDAVAAALFMSKRTLARRLAQYGTSFGELSDQIKFKQAAYYLSHTALSVEAIANLLNYYDSSNFRRAFKRWSGQTPREFRQTHLHESAKSSELN